MEMTSTRTIPAPVETVWTALNDLANAAIVHSRLRRDRTATAKMPTGSLSRRAWVRCREIRRPDAACRHRSRHTAIRFRSTGRAGRRDLPKARPGSSLASAENGAATVLSYTVNAQVGGKIAQIGSRLVDGAAAEARRRFFRALLGRRGGASGRVCPRRSAASAPRTWIRYVAVALLAGLLAYLFWGMMKVVNRRGISPRH